MEEGDNCPEGCGGLLEYRVDGCSCHVNPPCSACVEAPLVCEKCGAEVEE